MSNERNKTRGVCKLNRRHIVFKLNSDYCAVDVEEILEIIELDTMVKTSANEIDVVLWGNKSMPVIDPIAMLTLNAHKPTPKSKIVMVEKEGKKFGILFDCVLGIVDVDIENVEEPMLNEPQYVKGIFKEKIKIFEPNSLLKKYITEAFDKIYSLELHYLEEGIKIHGEKSTGKDNILENIRLRSLNWTVRATREEIGDEFVREVIEIHDLISKL